MFFFFFISVFLFVCRHQSFSTRLWRRNYKSKLCQDLWASLMHSVTCHLNDLAGRWLSQWPVSTWPRWHELCWHAQLPTVHVTKWYEPQWHSQWPLCTWPHQCELQTHIYWAHLHRTSSAGDLCTTSWHDQLSMNLNAALSSHQFIGWNHHELQDCIQVKHLLHR